MMHTPRLLRRLARHDRGVALVEFAMVLPILLLLFAVIVEGGRLMWSYQSVITGVRDAARYIGRVTGSDICVTGGGLNADHVEHAEDLILDAGVAGEVDVLEANIRVFLEPCPTARGPYRVPQVAIATVEVDVVIRFPLAGVFTLVGGELGTITTTVSDQTRVFGA